MRYASGQACARTRNLAESKPRSGINVCDDSLFDGIASRECQFKRVSAIIARSSAVSPTRRSPRLRIRIVLLKHDAANSEPAAAPVHSQQPRAQKIKITLPIILLVLALRLMHIRLAHRECHGVHSTIQCTRSTYSRADHVLSTQASLKILQGSCRG
jgi:hypothetical protein